jgi:putative transposase
MKNMKFSPGQLYHVYNRGNNHQTVFFTYANYLLFLRKWRAFVAPHVDTFAYCLMPNHFHFLIRTADELPPNAVNQGIGTLLSSYTQAVNQSQGRSGSLFQQHTKAKNLSEGDAAYALTCFHYIHQNPYAAGLVNEMERWEFGSFKDYAGLRNGTLCNQTAARMLLDLSTDAGQFYEQAYRSIPEDRVRNLF